MKENWKHLVLLGVGAVLILLFLLRQKSANALGTVAGAQEYPNANPNPASFEVGGSPINITYNQPEGGAGLLPTIHVASPTATPGGNCNCDTVSNSGGCGATPSATLVTAQVITEPMLQSAADNLSGFASKVMLGGFPVAPDAWLN